MKPTKPAFFFLLDRAKERETETGIEIEKGIEIEILKEIGIEIE